MSLVFRRKQNVLYNRRLRLRARKAKEKFLRSRKRIRR